MTRRYIDKLCGVPKVELQQKERLNADGDFPTKDTGGQFHRSHRICRNNWSCQHKDTFGGPRESMQTPQRKLTGPIRGLNPRPSCCEATTITTTPPKLLSYKINKTCHYNRINRIVRHTENVMSTSFIKFSQSIQAKNLNNNGFLVRAKETELMHHCHVVLVSQQSFCCPCFIYYVRHHALVLRDWSASSKQVRVLTPVPGGLLICADVMWRTPACWGSWPLSLCWESCRFLALSLAKEMSQPGRRSANCLSLPTSVCLPIIPMALWATF